MAFDPSQGYGEHSQEAFAAQQGFAGYDASGYGGGGYDQQAYAQDSSNQWFSDPSYNSYGQSSYVQSGPVAPGPIQTTGRPQQITSVGFELPSQPSESGLGGSLGGLGGKHGYGANHVRFGISTYEGEPPLLVELGIDFGAIAQKTKSALHPLQSIDPSLMEDGDLAGPLVICLALGFLLMLRGRLHFGYIFGFGVVGCIAIYQILNLMTQKESGIELHVVFSVLGYSLIPISFVAASGIVLPLNSTLGWIIVPPFVGWCTLTATRFFEATLSAKEQRYLIAYPVFLFFACFALITVF